MRASFSWGLTRCLCDGFRGREEVSKEPRALGPSGGDEPEFVWEPRLGPCLGEESSEEECSEERLAYPSVMAMQSHAPSFLISGASGSFFRVRQSLKFAATRGAEYRRRHSLTRSGQTPAFTSFWARDCFCSGRSEKSGSEFFLDWSPGWFPVWFGEAGTAEPESLVSERFCSVSVLGFDSDFCVCLSLEELFL
jgi:hypothetical protein